MIIAIGDASNLGRAARKPAGLACSRHGHHLRCSQLVTTSGSPGSDPNSSLPHGMKPSVDSFGARSCAHRQHHGPVTAGQPHWHVLMATIIRPLYSTRVHQREAGCRSGVGAVAQGYPPGSYPSPDPSPREGTIIKAPGGTSDQRRAQGWEGYRLTLRWRRAGYCPCPARSSRTPRHEVGGQVRAMRPVASRSTQRRR